MPSPTPTADWQVTPKVLSTTDGVALVRIAVHNCGERLFHFGLQMEWPAGAEEIDMEAGGLAIFGTSMKALAEECRLEMLTRVRQT
ncbi:hypothetical protein BZG35_03515 [Brevundimonas sp. LM2]|uniref:hypothetical protein n=1 Tax=Brevundimonas sp. LM2 TaxID=1938605 RepID=UPI0009839C03|nr:hypothetical protein [Brevundimonas sp. LM2]AQR60824.1 hypothetical protein BZG35_03515 [Brevundimonas sp. LM2]